MARREKPFIEIYRRMVELTKPAIIVDAYDLGRWYGFRSVLWDSKQGPYSKEKALKTHVWTEYDCVNKKTGDRLFIRTVDIVMNDIEPVEVPIDELEAYE